MVLRIGHRGAKGYVDENTLESVKKAVSLNCDMIELDVRKCRTGEIILMHDKSVKRTTTSRGIVSSMPYDKLKLLRTTSGYKIPLLDDVLRYLKGKCRVIIEMKFGSFSEDVVRLVEKHSMVNDTMIFSYYGWELNKIKKLNPKIKTALLCEHRIALISRAKSAGCYAVCVRNLIKIRGSFVKSAHQNNLGVFAWPINSPEDIKRLKAIGVDGLISDYPDRV